MPKFNILPQDMTLYCANEPEGRLFRKGDYWPGDAWSDKAGGKDVGSATITQAMKDLIEAHETIERLEAQIASLAHSAGQADGRAGEATAELEALKQAAADAERRAEQAEADLRTATAEVARLTEFTRQLQEKIAKFDGDKDGEPGGAAPKDDEEVVGGLKRSEIIAALESLEVKVDKRLGTERLAALLAAERAAINAEAA